jgi:NitT/TauT family transport system substrate-binding protein
MKIMNSRKTSITKSIKEIVNHLGFQGVLKLILVLLTSICIANTASASEKKTSFTIAWSIYAGWMPWGFAGDKGIVDKWAKKYGLQIKIVQANDYVSSLEQFGKAKFDGCVMTNMDAMTMPAAGGLDSTALILGDYSNGNDAVVLKNSTDFIDLKGRNVNLVEFSVSHYLLLRALEKHGMAAHDVKIVNTSDAEIVGALKKPSVNAATVWNPQLSFIVGQSANVRKVFTSKEIPGEIIDMMVVNTTVLKANPDLGKALVGAWFETLELMTHNDAEAKAARTYMATNAGTTLADYDTQLRDTAMFYTPASSYEFANNTNLANTMELVRSFSKKIGVKNTDDIGVLLPDGSTQGNSKNIKLRFDTHYVKLAMDGKL